MIKIKEELAYLKARRDIVKTLENKVESEGFIAIEPAFFDDYDRFQTMNQRIKKGSLVKVIGTNGSILLLRPDATTAIIRQLMPMWNGGDEARLYYNTTVFSKNNQGYIEDIRQFGVEYLGGAATDADVDIIRLVIALLETFDLDFMIEIGNSKFLSGLMKTLVLSDEDCRNLKNMIHYKNRDDMNTFIQQRVGSDHVGHLLSTLFLLQGSMADIRAILQHESLEPLMQEAIQELDSLDQALKSDNSLTRVTFDLSLLPTYDYYDGITFKVYLRQTPRPILQGGRYDPLTLQFGQKVPAIGFSLNIQDFIKEVSKS
ncbi:MAG: hypothetical protein EA375_04230 [Acholeplasmataceae bacterium]|nr:MAG: hypothetical protein EA375_04230 [Acholeplasmataceae bacterium]